MVFKKKLGLAWELAKRDLEARYRGSFFGVIWSLIAPISLLVVYSFVFGQVFRIRWGSDTTMTGFALSLFAGLLVFNLFAECVQRSTGLIASHQNLVKKVIFPIEVLPLMVIMSALVQACIAYVVLVCAILVAYGEIKWTLLVAPAIVIPVVLMAGGFVYAMSSLAVYIRDIGQVVPIIVTAMMFLSPIFYPISSIPEDYRFLAEINPIAGAVEGMREAALVGRMPNWSLLAKSTVFGAIIFALGYAFFNKTKRGFADVL